MADLIPVIQGQHLASSFDGWETYPIGPESEFVQPEIEGVYQQEIETGDVTEMSVMTHSGRLGRFECRHGRPWLWV